MNADARLKLLIVDDDPAFSTTLARALERQGFQTCCATDADQTIACLCRIRFDRAVVDLRIGPVSGLSLVPVLLDTHHDMRIVVLTGFASIATAVEAIKLGAVNYLVKPASAADVVSAFDRRPGDAGISVAVDPMSIRRLEWEHLQKVLADHDGNISAAARSLRLHRRSLQRKLQKKPPNL